MKNKRLNKMIVKKTSLLLSSLLLSACATHASEPGEDVLNGKTAVSSKTAVSDVKAVSDKDTLKLAPGAISRENSIDQSSGVKRNKMSDMTKGQQIEHCKQDLAKQLEVELAQVSVLTTRPVTWRSGALGCPEQGVSYTQALVPGRVIVLAAGDEVYRYHTAVKETPFLCPNNRAESSLIQPGDL